MWSFIIIFQTESLRRNTKGILSFNATYWIYPLEFIPMYLKLLFIPNLIFHLFIHFYFILFFLFSLVLFYLGVEDYNFFTCTIQLQCHVIKLAFFLSNLWFRKFNWGFLKKIWFHCTYWIVLYNCDQIILSNNQWNKKLHLVTLVLMLLHLMVMHYHNHYYRHQKLMNAVSHVHQYNT